MPTKPSRIKPPSWDVIHRKYLALQFEELRHYAEALERQLDYEWQRFEKEFLERTAAMSQAERDDYAAWRSDDFHRLDETFPKILRYSLFVHSYSLLEHELLCIANHFKKVWNVKLSRDERGDKGITLAKTYLEKGPGVPFPTGDKSWRELEALNKVRNLIVHEMGGLSGKYAHKLQVEALVAQWSPDLMVDNGGRFKLSPRFIERVLETFETFLDDLFGKLKKAA